jgi:hypothetical protein
MTVSGCRMRVGVARTAPIDQDVRRLGVLTSAGFHDGIKADGRGANAS